jgi:hypothetical protein
MGKENTNALCLAEVAAPHVTKAILIETEENGWVQVLDGEFNTTTRYVAIALGDPKTGEYIKTRHSHDSNRERVIIDKNEAEEIMACQDGTLTATPLAKAIHNRVSGKYSPTRK